MRRHTVKPQRINFTELVKNGQAALFRLEREVIAIKRRELDSIESDTGIPVSTIIDTVAVARRGDNDFIIAVAIQSPLDNHNKKLGTQIAGGRVVKLLEGGQVSRAKGHVHEVSEITPDTLQSVINKVTADYPYETIKISGIQKRDKDGKVIDGYTLENSLNYMTQVCEKLTPVSM
jgi:hypothetical protein